MLIDAREIILVDTSVFVNVLDVPGFNQNRVSVLSEFSRIIKRPATYLFLPFASIIEAGNHIAQLRDGGLRRDVARIFAIEVAKALDGEAPWRPTPPVDLKNLKIWLAEYPDHAMREIGLGDLTIIKEWEAACRNFETYRVRIWSLDAHLSARDRRPIKSEAPRSR